MNTYLRLTMTDREEISRGLAAKWTYSHIAHNINRPVSTISREVKGSCKYKRCYRAQMAHRKALDVRHGQKQCKKLDADETLKNYVIAKLKEKWSPEEIAKRLKIDYPTNTAMRASHETIYTYLYCLPRGELKKELLKALRQERKFRRKRTGSHARRSTITDFISISERPDEVKDRIMPGHWEGDLIMGRHQKSAVGTLVERTTRYLLLVPLKEKSAMSVKEAFAKAVKKIPRHLKKTLTYDRGIEMTQHKLFTLQTKIQVYFADPHSPWQRGTNENTNGLIRQYFPKGTDFNTIGVKEIRNAQNQLNDRPRKVLDFYTPNERFSSLILNQEFALEG